MDYIDFAAYVHITPDFRKSVIILVNGITKHIISQISELENPQFIFQTENIVMKLLIITFSQGAMYYEIFTKH